MYFIEKITNINGVNRTDDKYPNRVGSIATFIIEPQINKYMIFEYIKENAYGKIVENHITQTSMITDIQDEHEYLIVTTLNSIYYFKKINMEDN